MTCIFSLTPNSSASSDTCANSLPKGCWVSEKSRRKVGRAGGGDVTMVGMAGGVVEVMDAFREKEPNETVVAVVEVDDDRERE